MDNKKIDMDELAKAFGSDEKSDKKLKKSKKFSIAIFCIGLITLIAGVVILILNLTAKPGLRDAEYLVKIGSWQRENAPGVIWTFTEVGKGTLTVNNHVNDYDFIWAIDDNELKLETAWLYNLNDTYTYKIDQSTNKLTLTSGENGNITFIAASHD